MIDQTLNKLAPGAPLRTESGILNSFRSRGTSVGISCSGTTYWLQQDLGGGRTWWIELYHNGVAPNDIHSLRLSHIESGGVNIYDVETVAGVWEYALEPMPVGATNITWVGNAHGYDYEQSLTITVDGVPVVLGDGESASGAQVVLTRVSRFKHPDTGPLEYAEMTATYTLTPSGGLRIDYSLHFLANGNMVGGWDGMWPITNAMTRFSFLGDDQDYSAVADDGASTFFTSQAFYAWDVIAAYAVLLYCPTGAMSNMMEDRIGDNKMYSSSHSLPLPFLTDDVWTWSRVYQIANLGNPAVEVGNNRVL